MIALINSLVGEARVLDFTPVFVHSRTDLATSFNTEVQGEVDGLYV
jgi:hypothetical protein